MAAHTQCGYSTKNNEFTSAWYSASRHTKSQLKIFLILIHRLKRVVLNAIAWGAFLAHNLNHWIFEPLSWLHFSFNVLQNEYQSINAIINVGIALTWDKGRQLLDNFAALYNLWLLDGELFLFASYRLSQNDNSVMYILEFDKEIKVFNTCGKYLYVIRQLILMKGNEKECHSCWRMNIDWIFTCTVYVCVNEAYMSERYRSCMLKVHSCPLGIGLEEHYPAVIRLPLLGWGQ